MLIVELSRSGNAAIVCDLCAITREARSHLVFLCETRQSVEKISKLRRRLGLSGFVGISSEGMSGGLALFWHESVYVDIKEIIKDILMCMCVCPLMICCGMLPLFMENLGQRTDIICGRC